MRKTYENIRHIRVIAWTAIIDSKSAQFYERDSHQNLRLLEHSLIPKPINTEMLIKENDHNSMVTPAIYREQINERVKTLQTQRFIINIAAYLNQKLEESKYNRLVIVTSPNLLGLLHKQLSKPVKDSIALELDKDFMQRSNTPIKDQLEKVFFI